MTTIVFGIKYPYTPPDSKTQEGTQAIVLNDVIQSPTDSTGEASAPVQVSISKLSSDSVTQMLTYGNPMLTPLNAGLASNAASPTTNSAPLGLTTLASSPTTSDSRRTSLTTDYILSRNLTTALSALSSANARLSRMSELIAQMGAIASRPVVQNDFGNLDGTFQNSLNQISTLALSTNKKTINLLSGNQGLSVSLDNSDNRSRSLVVPRMDIIQTISNQLLSNISVQTASQSQTASTQLNSAALMIGNFQNTLSNSAVLVRRELAVVNARLEAALAGSNG